METYRFKFGVQPHLQYTIDRNIDRVNRFYKTMVSEAEACDCMKEDVRHLEIVLCQEYGLIMEEDPDTAEKVFSEP